jgi:DNA helicase-2/ATP-dependent DNA helicase PcrA
MNSSGKIYTLKSWDEGESRFTIDYAKALNGQQLAAVTAPEGPALVIAGAGSGKTRTLVYRVAYLIEKGVPAETILLLTFTRKAAQEMLLRVGELIGGASEQVLGGTFHAVANLLLRRHGRSVGLEPGFTILDRGDAEDLINLLRAEAGLSGKEKRFPRKGTIADIFSKSENTCQELEHIVFEEFPHFAEQIPDLQRLKNAYDRTKLDRQLVDYDDLLVKLRDLLHTDAGVAQVITQRFQWILVDEYQDTNRLQAQLIRALAGTRGNLMAVGDDSQSIYGFRGATFRNIMEFPTLFPGTVIFKLEENFRSTQPILNLANQIIEAAPEKYSKRLFTRQLDGPLPALVEAPGEHAQSRFVAQRILELHEEGVALGEIAVLFRSSFHAFDLEIELSRRGLPFTKRGGVRFVETAHVKDLLAHLRVLQNPRDAVSWQRLLLLIEGIGPRKAQDLVRGLFENPSPTAAFSKATGRSAQGLKNLAQVLEALSVADSNCTPAEQVTEIYEYYLPILKEQYDDYPKRIRDLEHLASMADRYASLGDFLADLALEPPEVGAGEAEGREDRLIISTVHSAKGLEWQALFVIWAVDGRFPSVYSFAKPEEIEEERRLFYVAVTRAKKYVYLIYPANVYDKSTGMILSKPSRFLDDVPATLLESWNLVEERDRHPWG